MRYRFCFCKTKIQPLSIQEKFCDLYKRPLLYYIPNTLQLKKNLFSILKVLDLETKHSDVIVQCIHYV